MTKYGWTPVEIAAINGHFAIVEKLVFSYGGDINQVNPHNKTTPLENAIEGGHLETVQEMIEKLGASYGQSILDTDYETAARLVISQGELINPGHDYVRIKDYLIGYHTNNKEKMGNFPVAISNKLDKLETNRLSRVSSIKQTTTTTVVTEIKYTEL